MGPIGNVTAKAEAGSPKIKEITTNPKNWINGFYFVDILLRARKIIKVAL